MILECRDNVEIPFDTNSGAQVWDAYIVRLTA
jgi:hypothetical protein